MEASSFLRALPTPLPCEEEQKDALNKVPRPEELDSPGSWLLISLKRENGNNRQ